ncbi:DUF6444 domain-containing protein [Motilimonas sp. 1_MG-2023]|nr:DUF6444 domain-containing protein [Motilimonas sp. 1_MG-2023]MDO6528216.1 DUF6444 domain-containing protein [Motilimonas sp. 1_MG-2023]
MADLEGRLAGSSSNSSKPPSSDGPDKKRKDKSSRNKPNSNKQTKMRGVQLGHAGSKRTLETLREDDTQV